MDGQERRALNEFAKKARAIVDAEADNKLHEAVKAVRGLLKDGYQPIVFCHFIPTANYVALELKRRLSDQFGDLAISAVTGDDPDEIRRKRIEELQAHKHHVLVATDCLSEGINLQEKFNAVVHYDLPWNPNRLEQREGRVDRFGQPATNVRCVTIWGRDNEIDQAVLDVLVRKAEAIRRSLGIAVPVPADAAKVTEAVVENVLFRRSTGQQLALGLAGQGVIRLHEEWDRSAERERENRKYYKHPEIKPDELAADLEINDQVLGDPDAVRRFMSEVCQRENGSLAAAPSKPLARSVAGEGKGEGAAAFVLNPGNLTQRLNGIGRDRFPARITFDRMKDADAVYLGRAHPVVAEACHAVLGNALGRNADPLFARAGANFTSVVDRRTALVLMGIRYIIREPLGGAQRSRAKESATCAPETNLDSFVEEFAEEIVLAAFEEQASAVRWLVPLQESALKLLDAPLVPGVNMPNPEHSSHVAWALNLLDKSPNAFAAVMNERRAAIEESNNRLRGVISDPHLTSPAKKRARDRQTSGSLHSGCINFSPPAAAYLRRLKAPTSENSASRASTHYPVRKIDCYFLSRSAVNAATSTTWLRSDPTRMAKRCSRARPRLALPTMKT